MCETVPGPFRATLLLAAGYLAFVAWDQSHWWRVKPDYTFGWLVPLFVAFVVHDRWPAILALVAESAAPGSPRAAGWHKVMLGAVTLSALVLGVLLFLLGALYRAGAGTSHPGTLAITLGAVGILLPLLLLNAPETVVATPSSFFGDARVRLILLFLFPTLIWLVSAPMVSVLENRLSLVLLGWVVKAVAFVFGIAGIPFEQHGNVIALPNGNVGVEDACSGIRSLTACLFAGSFLAAVFLDRGWKKIALVVAALLLAFLTNVLRSLFLTVWAYRHGPEAIAGTVHDVAGYAVLGLTVAGLLCLLPLLKLKFSMGPSATASEM